MPPTAIESEGDGAGEVSADDTGFQPTQSGRTAALRRVDGHLVVDTQEEFTDEILFPLIDAGRR